MGWFPLGLNTYSIRAMHWHDLPLLEYAAGLKLDAVYLQDSVDPRNDDPAHWRELKVAAARLGLELQGGDAGALPRTPDGMDATFAPPRRHPARGGDRIEAGALSRGGGPRQHAAGTDGADHGDHDPGVAQRPH